MRKTVTPTDTTTTVWPARECEALLIGVTGNVVVVDQNGISTTLTGLVGGGIYPISNIVRVAAGSTTATNIVRLWTN
jgi:hypothetical protein